MNFFYTDNDSPYEEMDFRLVYRLDRNKFRIDIYGKAAHPTIANVTNHSYFNLNHDKETILHHQLQTAEASIQLIDSQFVPTGAYDDFKTDSKEFEAFNFNAAAPIEKALQTNTALSRICEGGIDLAYCYHHPAEESEKIRLSNRDGSNTLIIHSDQEACVIYTANKITEQVEINNGKQLEKYHGITFEMQRKPNYVHEEEAILTDSYQAFTEYEII